MSFLPPTICDGVSVVIPTYQREHVLLDTIRAVSLLDGPPREILVVDQTVEHEPATTAELTRLQQVSVIRWIRVDKPSIPHAMNHGLRAAASELVLFLDDDIIPAPGLLKAHFTAHRANDVWGIVGQVLQPRQHAEDLEAPRKLSGLRQDFDFPFHSTRAAHVANVMAGNLSVKRTPALAVGGFDENFVGVAYRFETEFARRLTKRGGKIGFCPEASIQHLRSERGGTRSAGGHLASADPRHGVGDYYFAMRCGETWQEQAAYMLRRPFREVATRFHMTHPWYIPVKLIGEARAWRLARRLAVQGPKLLSQSLDQSSPNSDRP